MSWKYFYFLGGRYLEVKLGTVVVGMQDLRDSISKNLDEAAVTVGSGCQGTRLWFYRVSGRQVAFFRKMYKLEDQSSVLIC